MEANDDVARSEVAPAMQLVTRRPWAALGVIAAVLTLAAGCSPTPDATGAADPVVVARAPDSTREYLPGQEADVYLPAGGHAGDPVPVVVLIPGGGWQTADRRGLAPLAADLSDAGFVAVNAPYRAGEDGATFPIPVQDVLCASGFAVEAAHSAGVEPGPVVALGHSAGGHLTALAALAGDELAGQCPSPIPAITGLIGLAGVYDARAFEFALVDFFGGTQAEQPQVWSQGDPLGLVNSGNVPDDLRVLLLHGDADEDVPMEQSRAFGAALTRAGVPVRLDVVPGATHQSIYSADVTAPAAIAWIKELAAGASGG